MPRIPKYTDPIRFPQYADQDTRDVRGWILLVCTVLLPGSVQSLFGVRRFGRFALGLSLATLALVLLLGLAALVRRQLILTVATNPVILTVLTLWAIVLGVVWIVALVDTVRRIRPVGLSPRTRLGVLSAGLVSVLVVGGGLAWGTATLNSQRQLISEIFAGGLGQRPTDGRFNIALLGTDAGKGRQGIRPDSISLVSIDARTGESVIIGLPRNMQNVPFAEDSPLRAEYPHGYACGDECLLNAVYQLGEENAESFDGRAPAGAQAMKDAISGVTGVEVHYYAMIDLTGFESLIDAMGGISLVSGKRVPISSPVDKTTGEHGPVRGWIEPGELHLDGFHALWYARSREFASDYERMVRQRCVQEAMIAQLDPATVLTRYQAIAGAAPDVVSTDIPQIQVDRFVDLALKTKSQDIRSVNLTPPEVVPSDPDFDAVHAIVQSALEPAEARAASPDGPSVLAAGAAPAGAGAAAGAVPEVAAAAAPAEGEGEEKDRAICYVP
ncbi:LCP family protein [Brevibacterium ihuae]|uniref:LCP family protein n=1 Tax=Brevibacterium ihuae TaxID=1631743 RepID=UPI000C778C14|nr:LCP family protein [Brevibacterium ihuae]